MFIKKPAWEGGPALANANANAEPCSLPA